MFHYAACETQQEQALQYKNENIANFILAVLLERNWTNEFCYLEM